MAADVFRQWMGYVGIGYVVSIQFFGLLRDEG